MKNKVVAMQVVVYSISKTTLPDRLQREIEDAVTRIIRKHEPSIAYTIVNATDETLTRRVTVK